MLGGRTEAQQSGSHIGAASRASGRDMCRARSSPWGITHAMPTAAAALPCSGSPAGSYLALVDVIVVDITGSIVDQVKLCEYGFLHAKEMKNTWCGGLVLLILCAGFFRTIGLPATAEQARDTGCRASRAGAAARLAGPAAGLACCPRRSAMRRLPSLLPTVPIHLPHAGPTRRMSAPPRRQTPT